jgi:hypothetical protein
MNRRDFMAASLATTILPKTDFLLEKPLTGMQISVFSKTPKIDTKEIIVAMKRDLALLKTWLKDAGL